MHLFKPFWVFCFCLLHLSARSQTPLTEGTVVYAAHFIPGPAQADQQEQSGTYTLTIKGKQLRKELLMDNGIRSTVIFSGKNSGAYSLQAIAGQHYAIQITPDDLRTSATRKRGYVLRDETNTIRTIAGYNCQKATIAFSDGSSGLMFYTRAIRPSNDYVFDRFPSLDVFPLYFEYNDDNGMLLRFEAQQVKHQPVEAGQFRIPRDYKVISAEEYQSLQN